RYDYAAEPFYLPTLWMARYYLRAGHLQRARELVRVCLDNATSLGLMAEHFNPRTGRQWGNFPQAFSHEELALTILELAAAGDAGGCPRAAAAVADGRSTEAAGCPSTQATACPSTRRWSPTQRLKLYAPPLQTGAHGGPDGSAVRSVHLRPGLRRPP